MLGSWRTSDDETATMSRPAVIGLTGGRSRAHAVKGESSPRAKNKAKAKAKRHKTKAPLAKQIRSEEVVAAQQRRDERVDALVAKKRAAKRASRHRNRPK
jgi:hypothetical protein